ncbi:DUF262 domain-containing protein [Pseudomonas chlororaphis]|uniref:DUF262 domain-containing protein n=1 Tax=Pseudomonas chlororaphis TaxID=587753 RepID=UPI000F480283|nr:DUF262 domain-containing protein [Pseudomonas chlororaphis]ROL86132.1 hypothetical protein BK637_24365 [Pseudomonas chlororaphis]
MAKKNTAPLSQTLQQQLDGERRLVSFDSYDLSVRQLLDMFESGEIEVPPEYQRQFIWDESRESQLIESVLLGIPVPSLFMATNSDSTWEIVDGVQRLGTLAHFLGTPGLLSKVNRSAPLEIEELEKLSALNGTCHKDLPKSVQLMFSTRPVRVTVLNDKSDLNVRFDLFERLNTGGISLTNQEIRNCVYRGPFNDDLKKLATDKNFSAVVNLKPGDAKNGTAEENALRFFAFLERYKDFDHSVKEFLNTYMQDCSSKKLPANLEKIFKRTFTILQKNLPRGVVRGNRGNTPVNLYEGIAVGTALAIKSGKPINEAKLPQLLDDAQLRTFTTGATNTKKSVIGRIEYVRDALI